MLVIQGLRTLRRLPILMLGGLLVMLAGGLLDVVLHLAPLAHDHEGGPVSEHVAHVVGIAGMSFVLAGLVLHGARRHRRPRAARQGGLDSNAHR